MRSMTGFGSGQASGEPGSITVEIRSVNSRYLDLQFRLPDELRHAEMPMREQLSKALLRGKVEVRANYTRAQTETVEQYPVQRLKDIEATYRHIRQHVPDVTAPTLTDILQWPDPSRLTGEVSDWAPLCLSACASAIEQLVEVRSREGARLATVIDDQAQRVQAIVDGLRSRLPELLIAQNERVATRLKEALQQAFPDGLDHISSQELSERLATEASLIALKADVAEELDRLSTHVKELKTIVGVTGSQGSYKVQGKRLDFLFQEMNREANTLGSKSVNGDMTQAAIELKLLVEQMREQVQNIE